MDNPISFISRLIEGIKLGSPLMPSVTQESLSSFIVGSNMDTDRGKDEYNISNTDTANELENGIDPSIKPIEDNVESVIPKSGPPASSINKRELYNYKFNKKKKPQTESSRDKFPRPEKKSLESLPEKKSLESLPEKKSLESLPEKKSLESLPEKKSLESLPENKNRDGIMPTKLNKVPDLSPYSSDFEVSRLLSHKHNVLPSSTDINNDQLYQARTEKLKRNEISKRVTEASITINIGKITVKAVNKSNSYRTNDNESRQPQKLSLNDYLRKRMKDG